MKTSRRMLNERYNVDCYNRSVYLCGNGEAKMDIINCRCGAKDCPIQVRFNGRELWLNGKDKTESLMYVDANALVEIIKAARTALISLTEEEI